MAHLDRQNYTASKNYSSSTYYDDSINSIKQYTKNNNQLLKKHANE